MARDVEMEVITVKPVRIWAKNCPECSASRFVHFLQNASVSAVVPTFQDGDLAAVGKGKGGNINRFAFAVLADFRPGPIIPCPARIMCGDIDGFDAAAQTSNGGLHALFDPAAQSQCRWTSHRRGLRQSNARDCTYAHRFGDAAPTQTSGNPRHLLALDIPLAAQSAGSSAGDRRGFNPHARCGDAVSALQIPRSLQGSRR